MRRRKKGNPLLFKIVGIVILLHIIVLPILAKMGVFAKVEKQYTEATMVNLPPPEKIKEEPKKAEKKAPPPKQVAHASTPHAPSHAANNAHENLPQPKLMAGGGGPANGAGGDGGFAVNPNGNGKAGQLAGTTVTPTPAPATPAPEPATPTPAPQTQVATARATPAATPPPTPAPPLPPVYTEPQVVYTPTADLPQAMLAGLTAAIDATAVVEIAVDTDGKPTDAKIVQSAGNGDLDQQALVIAAKYRFKPATRDGAPVEGAARVHIEFQVN